jgi:5-methylcytosine-specific restriction endonuclease McrA
MEYLDFKSDDFERQQYRLRLHLAMHFCPKSALDYDKSSRHARFELIEGYLVEEFGFESDQVESLARGIAKLLDTWEKEREVVTSHKDRLLAKQNYRCRHCRVKFDSDPITAEMEDPYKPYHPVTKERLSPEVDHIEPISVWGTNDINNLQVICRLCNHGKGDGLGIDPKAEISSAARPVKSVGWSHRASMFFYVTQRFDSKCQRCQGVNSELTIRPIREKGCFVQSNLCAVCVDCAYK